MVETTKEMMKRLLSILVESQQCTAPIKLSIGHVSEDNQVQHNCIVIEECPGFTLDVLKTEDWVRMSIVKGGLLLEFW